MPRSARQQNEQARPVPNREDRSIVKLKILLQSWFPLRIRVRAAEQWETIRFAHRACDNCAVTMLKFCLQMEGDWFLLEMLENSRLQKTASRSAWTPGSYSTRAVVAT